MSVAASDIGPYCRLPWGPRASNTVCGGILALALFVDHLGKSVLTCR